MSTTQILILSFSAITLLLAAAVFTVAWRRGRSQAAAVGRLDREAVKRDISAAGPEPAGDERDAVSVAAAQPPPPDPLTTRPEISAEAYDVTRRQFFNRGILGIFGIFLAQFGIASLAFMWPKLKPGGFGSKVNIGKFADLEKQVFLPDGRVSPLFVSSAQAYILPFQGDPTGSSFDGLPVIAEGLMALWQRCVHLGCRVPTCESSQGFECPCHGSKYNYHGEYESGPAPRNLDRFVVSVADNGDFIVDTGQIIQTARSTVKTAEYPQGPNCV